MWAVPIEKMEQAESPLAYRARIASEKEVIEKAEKDYDPLCCDKYGKEFIVIATLLIPWISLSLAII